MTYLYDFLSFIIKIQYTMLIRNFDFLFKKKQQQVAKWKFKIVWSSTVILATLPCLVISHQISFVSLSQQGLASAVSRLDSGSVDPESGHPVIRGFRASDHPGDRGVRYMELRNIVELMCMVANKVK